MGHLASQEHSGKYRIPHNWSVISTILQLSLQSVLCRTPDATTYPSHYIKFLEINFCWVFWELKGTGYPPHWLLRDHAGEQSLEAGYFLEKTWQTQLNDQNQNAIFVLDLRDTRPVTVASKQDLKNMYCHPGFWRVMAWLGECQFMMSSLCFQPSTLETGFRSSYDIPRTGGKSQKSKESSKPLMLIVSQ